MVYKLDKTLEVNNPETYVLTHNRINTYLVLIFSDLNKAQIYKMPYRDSPHHKIEIVMSFNYLIVVIPNEHTIDYHIRKSNEENFLFEIEGKKYIYVGGKPRIFETNDTILNYSSELGFKVIKFPYAYGENHIYFLLHRKKIPIQEHKISTLKKSISIYLKREMNMVKIL